MNLDRFVAARESDWHELEALSGRAGTKAQRLGPEGVLRLGALYRSATADLAFARRRFPREQVTRRLEALVLRSRQAVYADEPGRMSLRAFMTDGYWRRLTERPVMLFLALLLLFGPMALAVAWALDDPAAAAGIVPQEFAGAAGTRPDGGFTAAEKSAFASQIFTNNIGVSFTAFAGGILLGVGTAAALLFNGGFIGAIMGLSIDGGASDDLFRFILPHGFLDFSIIAVAGYAGMRMGWAIVDPGTLSRGESLRRQARASIEIIIGTIPWFVLAGLVEGFVSNEQLPVWGGLLVGLSICVPYWFLVVWRGALVPRRNASPRGDSR